MSIYTGGGDKGKTSLLSGERVSKADPRVEAYGTLDELTAQLGVCRAQLNQFPACAPFAGMIVNIQRDLFRVGMQLSSSPKYWSKLSAPINSDDIQSLEQAIDALEKAFGLPGFFVSPGRTLAGASLHVARTICRRAERQAWAAAGDVESYALILKYINRLSDLLFSLSWTAEIRILLTEELSHGNHDAHL
ncbi:ATP/cobalamin adenosyltransferase [Desulfatibacillum aliphaticivorans]|uniref:Corrinoid adenosyltransferase n=1 Tax=Desulfatibacillum aliphaticivorans TaxID=218208 RepID=B8FDM9_DESAL|nr:cob(I)yrinic acid a,c-diamide adenosyltransferase [Desulfatibacillum aliphaticivorans]ACL06660.1 ATP/cobalamin adenosyltransferase [Desulfatibacillum aliphaticivorans]